MPSCTWRHSYLSHKDKACNRAAGASDALLQRCLERPIFEVNSYQWRRPVLGACREALQDPSSKRAPSFVPLPRFCSPPLLQRMMLPAMLLPSFSSAGTSAGCGSGWDSWAGISFIDSCARSAYPRPAPCCAKADWLNQTMVNLVLMFHASLDLPIVAALIAPLLFV